MDRTREKQTNREGKREECIQVLRAEHPNWSASAQPARIMSEVALSARCAAKEAEMNEVERRLVLLIEKIDASSKRLPKRPGVNGDQVGLGNTRVCLRNMCEGFVTTVLGSLLRDLLLPHAVHSISIHDVVSGCKFEC